MSTCDAIRERLAEDGAVAADSAGEIQRHLAGCADCARFLDELRRLETALGDLPTHDAPDALVADTLRAVRRAAQDTPAEGAETAPARQFSARRFAGVGLAASAVIAAVLGLALSREWLDSQRQVVAEAPPPTGPFADLRTGDAAATGDRDANVEQFAVEKFAGAPRAEEAPSSALRETEAALIESEAAEKAQSFELAQLAQNKAELDALRSLQDSESSETTSVQAQPGAYRQSGDRLANEEIDRGELQAALSARIEELRKELQERRSQPLSISAQTLSRQGVSVLGGAETTPDTGRAGAGQSTGESGGDAFGGVRADAPAASADIGNQTPTSEAEPAAQPAVRPGDDKADEAKNRRLAAPGEAEPAPTLAAAFLKRYRSLDGLTYQEPTGYWSNSYIPGDPAMRLLEARLKVWDRSAFGPDARFEQAVRPVEQPFDAPQHAAMALYLSADATAIDGPTRLQIQVGLKGAERQGGHRPAMNLGLLVDLRDGVQPDSARRIRALIDALEQARQPEDRFSLTVAGPDGGLLVAPEDFRHGPLQVALERLFAEGQSPVAGSSALSLPDAFAAASRSVRAGDDPEAVLGSSLVLLVIGSSLADDLAPLERMAHLNAVAGVPTSVVSLAGGEDLDHVDRLVAAGQGNRRVLDQAEAADGVIDRELNAASRAVARALRLRIRLAPGVQLVDVLGSRRLDEALAQRVREAEVAIDRRLARNLGIVPDRGEDEEGIQIVIPNFYAGDSHTILLDVVATQPGPLADVTLRYKDVVNLTNGAARANLTLEDGARTAGPLERNVLKNLVAWETAQRIRQAAAYLREGKTELAQVPLYLQWNLLGSLRGELPDWQGDPDLLADQAMMEDFLRALGSPAANDTVQRDLLADSLSYAAFRKLQTAAR